MNSKWMCVACILVLSLSLIIPAMAETTQPRADLYFGSAGAYLASDKYVTFSCTTYDVHSQISIVSVWLEKKVNGEWQYVKALTRPSYVARNAISYAIDVNYSSSIGTGTYRVGFTASADGHEITRYSNNRTF